MTIHHELVKKLQKDLKADAFIKDIIVEKNNRDDNAYVVTIIDFDLRRSTFDINENSVKLVTASPYGWLSELKPCFGHLPTADSAYQSMVRYLGFDNPLARTLVKQARDAINAINAIRLPPPY